MASRILSMQSISSGHNSASSSSHSSPSSSKFASPNNSSSTNSTTNSYQVKSYSSSSSDAVVCEEQLITPSRLKSKLASNSGSQLSSGSGSNLNSNYKWNLGLMKPDGKYLTAENFGFKINASGNTLRKKQKWQIEQDLDEFFYLISPLGCYLSTDKYGKLTCEKLASDDDCKFFLETNASGKWAFKSASHGYYFGGSGDHLHCFSKTPEWWIVHLAIHPQINLRHVLRKRYARLEDDEIHVDEIIPWGSDCLITIEFRDEKYAIRTSNGMYLHSDGKLTQAPSEDTLFNIEMHKGCVAFKNKHGKYLTAVGPQGVVTARSKSVTKDELFIFDPNHIQISMIANNGKLVSVKQGVDVSANQIELADTETFQLEEDTVNEKWSFRTNTNRYWKLDTSNGVQANSDLRAPSCLFDMVWIKAGHVVLRAANGKYVSAAATGHMRATSDTVSDLEVFRVSLVNRPILVLKCEYGLIGYKNRTGYKLECNKSTFNVIMLEECDDGYYTFKGSHGLYWDIGSDNSLSANSTVKNRFSMELLPNNKMLIRGPNGCYLKLVENLLFSFLHIIIT